MKARVYWDSVKNVYSVVNVATGHVEIKTTKPFVLDGARLTVTQSRRERVVSEGRRNLHAFLHGDMDSTANTDPSAGCWLPVTYNPKRDRHWVYLGSGEEVHEAAALLCTVDAETGRPRVYAKLEAASYLSLH